MYETFGADLQNGRGMHMCGDSTHLHQSLVEDLKITSFDLFGYRVTPEVAARNLGGKMLLWGNINPMLMLKGRSFPASWGTMSRGILMPEPFVNR